MITPYILEELFEPNYNKAIKCDNHIYIDDFFKNYEEIHNCISNSYIRNWKSQKNSRNFKDYYDCRETYWDTYPNLQLQDKRISYLTSIIKSNFNVNNTIFNESRMYDSNLFRLIEKKNNNIQARPHIDEGFVMIIYIDKECSGGTALYNKPSKLDECYNLLHEVTEDNTPYNIIKAKPNRCVIFNGNHPHASWIYDNNVYYNNWRINIGTLIKYN